MTATVLSTNYFTIGYYLALLYHGYIANLR